MDAEDEIPELSQSGDDHSNRSTGGDEDVTAHHQLAVDKHNQATLSWSNVSCTVVQKKKQSVSEDMKILDNVFVGATFDSTLLPTGEQVLAQYDMDNESIGRDFGILIAMAAIYRFLWFVVLYMFRTGKR
ncbi:hypothetical protein PTSG_07391 [Salpingoeca rosetta]|uniref:CDR ABC transporter domain-containing protein n=1 Tax=Salpingoeca rosetta (strain ATCC 50818 / BSB-021) TaxID=946362 RepID=F2UIK1_SALR5|nr:uncharacterized protein PTSG_07391 [Salpingoeca rosetta]EGD77050.1 hypothetical protein PTSG_07391 [Salpingoeca rosetta]|eukprot:XP_004990890.1 hypothetical protein PTSG_07391 [Salpingoeca rosetta]